MTHCINPDCQNSDNTHYADHCSSCGQPLLLKSRYRCLELLGQGKYGRTFLAIDEDKPSKPRCAIKQFFSGKTDKAIAQFRGATPGSPKVLTSELMLLDELTQHPLIPELYASFEDNGSHYLIQEYVEGQNLAAELAESGPFNEKKIRQILTDVLPVLKFVHNSLLIHRDIKPENLIRRRRDGKIILVDFGTIEHPTGMSAIASTKALGSAEYAAPEQTKGQAVPGSDLYSLGVTCLHLLTGLPPFDLYSIKTESWVWSEYLTQPVSLQLSRVLDTLVQRDVKQRYSSSAEALKALNAPNLEAVLPPPNKRVATLVGGAAIAVLSMTLGYRAPTPVPVSFQQKPLEVVPPPAPPQMMYRVKHPELSYKLPAFPEESSYSVSKVEPMRTLAIASGPVWSVAVSPDGSTIASGSTDGTIQLWHVSTNNVRVPLRILSGHSDPVWTLAISPNGQFLASGSADKTIKLWDLKTGELLGTLKGHKAGVFSVAFSPDSQSLASGSFDKSIKVWRLHANNYSGLAGSEVRSFIGHSQEVQSVAFSSDGQTLASGSTDGTVKLWNWQSGKLIRTLLGHSDAVWSVAFSPDGNTIASGSWDKTIKLWDFSSGLPVRTLKGHSEQVHSVAFNPDGQTLASGDLGGTIKLWKMDTGSQVGTLKGHSDWVGVAFSKSGKTLVSGSFDDTIKLWKVNP